MKRAILLSEVNGVAGRFPQAIAAMRAMLVDAGLPEVDGQELTALANRVEADPPFREEMHTAVSKALQAGGKMTRLELLGILVVAAIGQPRASALQEDASADRSLRLLFDFVLEHWRRLAEVAAGTPESWSGHENRFTAAEADPEPALDEPLARTQDGNKTDVPETASARKPLVTMSSPGRSAMLARALALAAEADLAEDEREPVSTEAAAESVHHVPAGREALPWRPAAFARSRAFAAEEDAHETAREPVLNQRSGTLADQPFAPAEAPVRTRRQPRETAPPTFLGGSDLIEDDEPEAPPRRWGLGTAAMVGVLLGFGVGAFVHFDHKAAPVSGQSAAAVPGVPAATTAPRQPEKSVEELQREIAALDSVANIAPTGETARAGGRKPSPLGPELSSRYSARSARGPKGPAQDPGPLPAMRSQPAVQAGAPAQPGPASAPAAGTAAVTAAAGHNPGARLLSTSVNPAMGRGPAPANSSFADGVSVLPHVVTGSAGIMAANLVSSPAPAYPVAASAAGVQGEVVVEAVVGRDGGVVETRVVSGPPMLRAAALDAVQRWHYRPYEVGGKPIEVATTARLDFRLDR